jgi:hypothetical protein
MVWTGGCWIIWTGCWYWIVWTGGCWYWIGCGAYENVGVAVVCTGISIVRAWNVCGAYEYVGA